MYCQNCGNEVVKGNRFCPHCGQMFVAAPGDPTPIAQQPASVDSRAGNRSSNSSKRTLILFGVVVLIGLVVATYFLVTEVFDGGASEQGNAIAAVDDSNTASTKSNDALAREMAMTCFLYDTSGVEQADGTVIGSWWVGGDDPSTQYKDFLFDIRPIEVSRSEQANGLAYQAYAYVDYLYADLDGGGGGWQESEKSYKIHISAAGDAWEGLDSHLRRCGLPLPDSVVKATAESENALQSVAEGIEVELAHPLSDLNWKVVKNPDSPGSSYQLHISFKVTNTTDVEKRFWVFSWMDACTCVSSDRGTFWPLEGEDRWQEVILSPHETQTITLRAYVGRKQDFKSLNVVKLQIQDEDHQISREWKFTH